MIAFKQDKWGRYVEVSIPLVVYIPDEVEITEESVKKAALEQLDNYAGSNDGSEYLANIQKDEIKLL